MKQHFTRHGLGRITSSVAMAAALTLTGCGGGGGGVPEPNEPYVRLEKANVAGVPVIIDNDTGITWAGRLGAEGLPATATLAKASELLALTTVDANTLSLNFPFVTGESVATAEAPLADQPVRWTVDFGRAGDAGTLALEAVSSSSDYVSWYVLSRPASPEPTVWTLDGTKGVVTGGGLMWKLCSEPSSWQQDSQTCSLNQTPWSYSSADARVTLANGGGGYAGHTGWRLPTKQELQSLMQLQINLSAPSANLMPQAFQKDILGILSRNSFPVPVYWSASRGSDGQQVWEADFSGGQDGGVSLNPDVANSAAYLRLVRTQ
jgi:hypothetical protein